jgi:DNA-binding response OmpR family regulator
MKILIIEDNLNLAKALQRGLQQEGYLAEFLSDGKEGRERIQVNHNEYDLIILDRMLPSEDGVKICQQWRANGLSIPVLMLTAKDTTEDKIIGLDAGADDYLVKPFALNELLARLRALLRRPAQTMPDQLKIKDLTLDPQTRTVTKGQKKIILTLKEFMILEYLMRHPNQVVTREELYDHAWDFADNPFSNTIDVHLKNLRKKIDYRNEKLLQTIRGIGYRIAE